MDRARHRGVAREIEDALRCDLVDEGLDPLGIGEIALGEGSRLRLVEGLPVILLLGATIGMVVQGEGVLHYMQNTAASLHNPSLYIRAVTIEAGALGGPVGERP